MSSSPIVSATTASIHHIRRLTSSTSYDGFPFQNEKEFHMHLAAIIIFIVCFIVGAYVLNAIIRCVYKDIRESATAASSSFSSSFQQKLAQMSIGQPLNFSNGLKLAGAENHAECAICLSEFVEGEGIRVLSRCNHGFHANCIESWLISRTSCPTCRTSCLNTSLGTNLDGEQQQNDVVDVEAAGGVNPSESQTRVVQQ